MRTLQPCGTPAAYRRHLRHDQEACTACRAAHNAATQEAQARAALRRTTPAAAC